MQYNILSGSVVQSCFLPNEPVEKVGFSKGAPSAGTKIESQFLSSKVFPILHAIFLFP